MTDLVAAITGLCACNHSSRRHDSDGLCLADDCGCTALIIRDAALVIEPDDGRSETTAAGARTTLPSDAPAAVPARPAEPVMPEPGPEKPIKLTVPELLRRGRASELKPIVRLAERIDAQLEDLRERVTAEIHAATLKASIAELEAQLAERRGALAQVGKGKRTPPRRQDRRHACVPGLHRHVRHRAGVRRSPGQEARLPRRESRLTTS